MVVGVWVFPRSPLLGVGIIITGVLVHKASAIDSAFATVNQGDYDSVSGIVDLFAWFTLLASYAYALTMSWLGVSLAWYAGSPNAQ